MRQILCHSNGAIVARMPRPAIQPNTVLVRVRYSLVSTGTEIAPLRQALLPADHEDKTSLQKAKHYTSRSAYYLSKAIRHPDKALQRVQKIFAEKTARFMSRKKPAPPASVHVDELSWHPYGASDFSVVDGIINLCTDDSPFGYQVVTDAVSIPEGLVPVVRIRGEVTGANISIGLLNESKDAWLGSRVYEPGAVDDALVFDPQGSNATLVVVANAGSGKPAHLRLDSVEVVMSPPTIDGLPLSELEDQGWNVGYSAAGEVVAVGEAIKDLKLGDFVACGGAGLANHAEFVCVPRNLVCPIPKGCSLRDAATTTVGSIAMQGVRRAKLELGERVAVIGLGLIGQMIVQIVRAAGCSVIGLDLDKSRVERALSLGMEAGAQAPDVFKRLVRDLTAGHGADKTIIAAAAKTDAIINLSMETTRAKGVVVIVGDVGMHVQRQHFYRKEIDLLMSTSYGPGRYDREYEFEGRDYPYSYVRWTMNRNMQAYMELISSERVNVSSLIDKTVRLDEAPTAYAELAKSTDTLPLGVVIEYPDDSVSLVEPPEATRITIRGHRKSPQGVLRYALVGAGAFGTCMLVPQMAKRKDRFFLRAVVSRDAVRGGNFARQNQVEILSSELEDVLADPDIDLVVIATRHNEHADQVIACLRAGKHVFVEKPLALRWDELDAIDATYRGLSEPPLLMVGFNRRFSPAMEALRRELQDRRSPMIINYRLNGGYIPLNHWIQDKQGGGRNIGEACHMYDVFRSLAGANVASIQAQAIHPGQLPYLRNDNFVATLTYEDGSVGNLVYTALGPKSGLPKERVEVFCDGEAYVMDDYRKLTRAADGVVLWESNETDKGHAEELSRFGDAVASGASAPISYEEIMETSAVSLHIEDMLSGKTNS